MLQYHAANIIKLHQIRAEMFSFNLTFSGSCDSTSFFSLRSRKGRSTLCKRRIIRMVSSSFRSTLTSQKVQVSLACCLKTVLFTCICLWLASWSPETNPFEPAGWMFERWDTTQHGWLKQLFLSVTLSYGLFTANWVHRFPQPRARCHLKVDSSTYCELLWAKRTVLSELVEKA